MGIGWQEIIVLGCVLFGLLLGGIGLFSLVYLAVKMAQKK